MLVNKSIRFLILAVLAINLSLASGSFAYAEDHDPYAGLTPDERVLAEQASREIDAGNCDVAWDIYWKIFREGQPLAASGLAFGIFYGGLIPPNSQPDVISQMRHLFILSAYGASSDDQRSIDFLNSVHGAFRIGGHPFLECLDDPSKSGQQCVDQAIEAGLIPPIEAYANELEKDDAIPARCLPEGAIWPDTRYPDRDIH